VIGLDGSLGEKLEYLKGRWHLETGYSHCAVGPGVDQLFWSHGEGQAWVLKRITRARERGLVILVRQTYNITLICTKRSRTALSY